MIGWGTGSAARPAAVEELNATGEALSKVKV
jgi:hypothetical protein